MILIGLVLIFLIFHVFVVSPVLFMVLSRFSPSRSFSYEKSIRLVLLLTFCAIVFQAVQYGFSLWLSSGVEVFNIIFSIFLFIVLLYIIKIKMDIGILRAALFQLINSIVAIGLALLFRTYVCQAYVIPAGSNIPTILIGDHILVNKYIYTMRNPRRNEFIIFSSPKNDGVDYLKRVVALPGDTLEIVNKRFIVNGIRVKEQFVQYSSEKVFAKEKNPRDNFGPLVIPDMAYFVLGDNRDNSFDSRFFGPISSNAIKGRAEIVYFSADPETKSVRVERIGLELR